MRRPGKCAQAVLAGSLIVMGGLALEPPPARAQQGAAAAVSVSVPAGALENALLALGRQANLQLVYSSSLTAGKTTGGVSGQLSSQAAVSRLLAGTGLSYTFTGANTVRIFDPNAGGDGAAATVDGAIALDTIDVHGGRNAASGSGYQGTPDWVYEAPRSVSVVSREAIQSGSARNARELLASTPGVLVSGDNNQNQGINVNIRGLQDQGRVNMMIDGARQNFQRAGHGSTGYTYIDPALVRTVEVEKNTTSGVGGAGVLAGSVNFRTLITDDLIRGGKDWGAEVNTTTGTNEYDFSGSASGAVRLSDSISILGGFSHKRLGQYDIGRNGSLDSIWELQGLERPIFTGSETWSGLLKAEIKPADDMTLDLSWLRYKSTFSQGANEETIDGGLREDIQDTTNDTLVAAFAWNPVSDLIDLKARFWFNRTDNDEQKARRTDYVQEANVNYVMESFGGSIENTSRLSLPLGALALNYGAEAYRDDGQTTATGPGIETEPLMALWYGGATPSGRRDVVSGFANATLEHEDWLTITGGLRYDHYRLSGSSTVIGTPYTETINETVTIPGSCTPIPAPILAFRDSGAPQWTAYVNAQARLGNTIVGDTRCQPDREVTRDVDVWRYPSEQVQVDISDGALLPSAKIAFKPWDGVQLFGGYSRAFRPPTIMEAFITGSHVGGLGPGYAPNPSLTAESGNTYEAGLNYSRDGIFTADDHFRGKVVGFHREVGDYIALGKIDADSLDYASYVNLDGTTRMKGVEIEANYDAGRYYVGGAFSYIDTAYASTYTYNGTSYNTEQYIIFTVPKMTFSLDAGLRLFDERLTVGGRVTHVEPEAQATGTYPSLLQAYASEGYRLYDLYGSYKFDEITTLRFAVNNLTDEAYVPVLGSKILPAPGRTATVGLQLKF